MFHWIRDRDILSLVSGGIKVNSCILFNQVDHSTQFCPLQVSTQQCMTISTHRAVTKQANYVHVDRVDRQGHTRVFFDDKEVCNNFNNIKGCYRSTCNLLHAYNKCRLCHPHMHHVFQDTRNTWCVCIFQKPEWILEWLGFYSGEGNVC
jgi:hypothetical protein